MEEIRRRLCASPEPEWNGIEGVGWPREAFSMIGMRRMQNIRDLIERSLDVPGDVAECGVWRGGACIFMRAVLKAHNSPKKVFVCDSFEGLPKPTNSLDPDWSVFPELAVSLEQVKKNFDAFGLLDEQVLFLKGWFKDTLPGPIEQLSLLRLDGDLYASTMDCLNALYPKLSIGGYLIVDDYYGAATPMCKQAVDDYRKTHGIETRIEQVDWCAGYWRKDG